MTEPAVAQTGRVETFEEFFHAHYERLLRTMYLTTGDRHEAEDLAQDAMVRVYERWDRVSSLDDPVGYAFRIALNLRRSRLRRLAVAARATFRGKEDVEPAEGVEDRDVLRRGLARLSLDQREALVLLEWLDLTDAQAAELLGVSPGAVRTRASRARAILRKLIEEDLGD